MCLLVDNPLASLVFLNFHQQENFEVLERLVGQLES